MGKLENNLEQFLCLYCKAVFIKKSVLHSFCSEKCRATFQANKLKEERIKKRSSFQCEVCNKSLSGRQRKYCSSTCKSLQYYQEEIKDLLPACCDYCSIVFSPTRKQQKYCSLSCSAKASRDRKWLENLPDSNDISKGYRFLDKNIGYVRIKIPTHPRANNRGYVYEHIVIAEYAIGRPLLDTEVVHHKNGNRWDNRPENLEVMDKIEHAKLGGQRPEDLSI